MATQRSEQKSKTRAHLYDTAMRLFERHGYGEVNVDDIVRHSRVARGTFYFHFPTKDDVLLEAVRRGEARIVERLGALKPGCSLREVLSTTTAAFAEVWEARRSLLPHAGAVGLRRIGGEREAAEQDPLRLELSRQLSRAMDDGELRSILPAQMLADVFLLNVFAALMAWAKIGQPSLAVTMAAVIELFLRGAEGFAAPHDQPVATRARPSARKPRA